MKARVASVLRRAAQRLDPIVEVVPEVMRALRLALYDREGRLSEIHWHGPSPPATYDHQGRHYLKTVERWASGAVVYREP